MGIFLLYILFFAAIFEGNTNRPLAYAGALSLCGRFLWLPFKLLDLPVAEPVILVQVPAHGVKQEFLEHFFLGTVVEPAEVLVLLDVPEVPFCLDGPDLAVQDPLFALDVPMGLFFQVLPAFIDLHHLVLFLVLLPVILVKTSGFVGTSAAVCASIYLYGLFIAVLVSLFRPDVEQLSPIMAHIVRLVLEHLSLQ